MRKIRKIIKDNYIILIGLLIGIIVTGTGVYAATVIASSEVGYIDNANLGVDNVQDALDKIYEKSETHCPNGYNCTENYTCSGDNCKKCVRGTTLHTETCNSASDSGCILAGYSSGDLISYGTIGENENLSTGDAFDCDVNGDGVYDEENERFYYVTDLDDSTAVLIYYSNVSAGSPNNSIASAYDLSGVNNNGPVTAIKQLPKTTQWTNISLKNKIRAIINHKGGTTSTAGSFPTAFSYEEYAARLLTSQEVEAACGATAGKYGLGELDNCNFLIENTTYGNSKLKSGYWLETPFSTDSTHVWHIFGNRRCIHSMETVGAGVNYGVRPVIEVAKTDISY